MRRAVLLLVPAFCAGILAAGCGGHGNKAAAGQTTTNAMTGSSTAAVSTGMFTSTTKGGTVTVHGRFHYPAILIRNYMRSCTSSARQSAQKNGSGSANFQAYCACTLDELSNNVSTRDFAEIGLSNGRIPPRIKRFMSNAVADCANKL